MYKNKHVVIAMIVAPILAVIGYFGVDMMVSEKPHAAKAGETYQLAEMPNCRYSSGVCGLKNGDFEVKLSAQMQGDQHMLISLNSALPLDGVKISLMQAAGTGVNEPLDMQSEGSTATQWSVILPQPNIENDRLQLVMSSNQVLYFGETHLTFINYETGFEKDFRRND
jgi:hypothetical protein